MSNKSVHSTKNASRSKPTRDAAKKAKSDSLHYSNYQLNQQKASVDYVQAVMNNTKWLLGVLATLYFALSLWCFDMDDPSWSRGVSVREQAHNWGGILGAYLSDIAYYLFGYSAWWLVLALAVFWYRQLRLLMGKNDVPYHGLLALSGLLLMLLVSPVLEYSVFLTSLNQQLPLGAGGFVSHLISGSLVQFLGAVLGQFLALMLALLALTFILQISWIHFAQLLGSGLEKLWIRCCRFLSDDNEAKNGQPENKKQSSFLVSSNKSSANPHATPKQNESTERHIKVNSAPVFRVPSAKTLIARLPQEGDWQLPDVSCLRFPKENQPTVREEDLQRYADLIEVKLAEFGIDVKVKSVQAGPVITRFEIEPAKGVKGSQIVGLSRDLARSMSISAVRIVETISGKNTMGIEVPNDERQEVLLQEIFTSDAFIQANSHLTVALGKDISGTAVVGDLAKMPHLLVGGMTGSGKSVGVNAMILSILFKASPDEVRMIMIDPKMLELSIYDGIAHLLCPVVTDMNEAGNALNWCVAEMEKRYRLLSHVGVRNLAGYNEKIQAAKDEQKPIFNPFSLNPDEPEPLEKLPQIVVIIDELADLMMTAKKTVEPPIARLAQKARAAGIHMIIATQRPSVDVITGLIKANVPTRMAFTVSSSIDSRTILDQRGAEDLLRDGDALFLKPGAAEPIRLQGAFVSDEEVHQVVNFIKAQGEPHYVDGLLSGAAADETNTVIHPDVQTISRDPLFDDAVQCVVNSQKASISSLQRYLHVGYNRAANLMQDLENAGVVSAEVSGKRSVLVRPES